MKKVFEITIDLLKSIFYGTLSAAFITFLIAFAANNTIDERAPENDAEWTPGQDHLFTVTENIALIIFAIVSILFIFLCYKITRKERLEKESEPVTT